VVFLEVKCESAGGAGIAVKTSLPETRPAPHGLNKIQPELKIKLLKSGRGWADRVGFSGSLPSLGRQKNKITPLPGIKLKSPT
jgi:hypothetical protein